MTRYLVAIFVMLGGTLLAALLLAPTGLVGFAFVQYWLSAFGAAVVTFALIDVFKLAFIKS